MGTDPLQWLARRKPEPEAQAEHHHADEHADPKDMTREEYLASLDSDADRRAYRGLLAEAKQHGATLANDGRGGLSPRLVRARMRKDGWRCKKCGGTDSITVHHKAVDNLVGPAVAALGHAATMKAIVTVCEKCHDSIHDVGREAGKDGETRSDQRAD